MNEFFVVVNDVKTRKKLKAAVDIITLLYKESNILEIKRYTRELKITWQRKDECYMGGECHKKVVF